MASSLKMITVPHNGPKHTATVIFMHVRRHPRPFSFLFQRLLDRDWVILATAGSQSPISSLATRVSNTLNGSSLTRK